MIKTIKLDTNARKTDAKCFWEHLAGVVDCVNGGIVGYVVIPVQEPDELVQVLNRQESDPRTQEQKEEDESSRFYVQHGLDETNEENFNDSVKKQELLALIDTERYVVLGYVFPDSSIAFAKALTSISE